MKHLDEGLLQAWLDHPRSGLESSEVAEIERHLASCEACARTLEALRGEGTEAHALLAGGVDRSVPRPPFEEVVRRARGHEEVRRARRRLNRLAWAASLVVALGVGWWSNDLYRQARTYEVEDAATAQPAASQEAPAAEERESLEPQVGAQRAPARADEVAPPSDAPTVTVLPEAAAARRERDAFADRAEPAAPPEPTSAANELASGAGAAAPQASDDDDLRAAPAQARARQAVPAVDADGGVVVTGVVRDEQGGGPVGSAQVYVEDMAVGALTQPDGSYRLVVPARDSVELTVQRIGYRTEKQAVSGRSGEPVVADFRLQQEALALQEVVVTGDAGRAPLAVEPVLGREPARIPTLAVLSVQVEGDLVRVRQDLGDAVVLTLVQGRAVGGTTQWPVESAGAVASRRVGDLLVTATAPLTEDSLRALLGAVR